VLIAVRDGQPVSKPGPAGGVLLAFTDDEAAAAWNESRHPAAPPSEHVSSAELTGGALSRRIWMRWLRQGGARTVALNAAGPLGAIVHDGELRTMRPRRLRRGAAPIRADHPWLDISARQAERSRTSRLLEALSSAISEGDRAAFDRVRPELPTINEIGSLQWAAQLQFLSGRHQFDEGNAKDGLHQMIFGSLAWGRFGDPYRCADGLIEAGGRLLEQPAQAGEWRRSYLAELTGVLERIRTGYRNEDAAALLAAAQERQ
jgi:hypothetical protein